MQVAVNYCLEHGRNISRTIRIISYPARGTLKEWIDELVPGDQKIRVRRNAVVQFSQEQKKDAVIELCAREGSAAMKIGI